MAVTGSRIGAKADNINETTLTRKPRPVGGELYLNSTNWSFGAEQTGQVSGQVPSDT